MPGVGCSAGRVRRRHTTWLVAALRSRRHTSSQCAPKSRIYPAGSHGSQRQARYVSPEASEHRRPYRSGVAGRRGRKGRCLALRLNPAERVPDGSGALGVHTRSLGRAAVIPVRPASKRATAGWARHRGETDMPRQGRRLSPRPSAGRGGRSGRRSAGSRSGRSGSGRPWGGRC